MKIKTLLRLPLCGVILVFVSFHVTSALAQDTQFPTKIVKIVVPYPAGVLPDAVSRIAAGALQKSMNQTFIVENHPGAGGALGAELVAKSNADGYTLLLGDPGPMAIAPATRVDLAYDPIRDFVPVSLLGGINFYLAVRGNLGVSSVKEFAELAKTKPGMLKYGTAGVASIHHLMFENLAKQLGIKMSHVPYRSGVQYMPALFNGEIDVALVGMAVPGVVDALKDGKTKFLAVTGAERDFQEKSYPTFAELGVPDMVFKGEFVVYAPAKTPTAVIAKLATEMDKVAVSPELSKFFSNINVEPRGVSGEVLTKQFRDEVQRYKRIANDLGLKAE